MCLPAFTGYFYLDSVVCVYAATPNNQVPRITFFEAFTSQYPGIPLAPYGAVVTICVLKVQWH